MLGGGYSITTSGDEDGNTDNVVIYVTEPSTDGSAWAVGGNNENTSSFTNGAVTITVSATCAEVSK